MIPRRLALFVAAACLAGTGTAAAHEHKVLGTVTTAAADHLMVKTVDGKDVRVKITRETKVTKGKQTVKPQTIGAGTRVVVTTESDQAPYTAKQIQVGVAAPKPPAASQSRRPIQTP